MRRGERGAGLVEFALAVPLLLLIMAGALDLGRTFQAYNVITNASREGARTAARLTCYTNNASQRATYRTYVVNAVINEAAGNGITVTADRIVITPEPASACANPGQAIYVQVGFDVQTWLSAVLGRAAFPLITQTAMSRTGLNVTTP